MSDYDDDGSIVIGPEQWEQRRWDAAVAATQGLLSRESFTDAMDGGAVAFIAINQANALIKAYRKSKQ